MMLGQSLMWYVLFQHSLAAAWSYKPCEDFKKFEHFEIAWKAETILAHQEFQEGDTKKC